MKQAPYRAPLRAGRSLRGAAPPRALATGGLAALALVAGCGGGAEPRPPIDNVLLFSIDTLRADVLGCYGNERAVTPAVDSLAERGLRFDRAYAQATMTNPSVTSILTGLFPPEHDVHNQSSGYAEGVVPLPVLAHDAGLATGAFIANMCQLQGVARTVWNDGWDEQYCGMMDDPADYHDQYLWDAAVVDAGLDWIAAQDGPWMAWMHLMDPHGEHRPPPHLWDYERFPLRTREAQYTFYNTLEAEERFPEAEVYEQLWDLYTAQVTGSDEQLARALETLSARPDWNRTAVVFFSDHGEELFETIPRSGHGLVMTDGVLRVPLIVAGPGVEAGVQSAPVEAMQITPTVLELLDIEAPYDLSGASLLDPQPSRGNALSFGNKVTTSVRGAKYRYWQRSTNRPFVRDYAPWKTASPWFLEPECLVTYESPDSAVPTWLDVHSEDQSANVKRLSRAIKRRKSEMASFGAGTRIDDPELLERLMRAGYVDPLELGTDDGEQP